MFLDESGLHTSMTRTHGRAARGDRVVGSVPRNRGTVTTVLGALTLAGVTALMTVEGGTSGAVFTAFVEQVLAPTLREGQVVVLDNLAAHKVAAARSAIEAKGARLVFQPPYSPDFNPIEECWSKVKGIIRGKEPRSLPELDSALVAATKQVSRNDALGWFRHAGYQIN